MLSPNWQDIVKTLCQWLFRSAGHWNAWDWVLNRLNASGFSQWGCIQMNIKLNWIVYMVEFTFINSACSGSHQQNVKAAYHWCFVGGIHRWPMDYPKNWPVTRKVFLCHDVVMWITSPILWITRNCVWNTDGTTKTHDITLLNTILSVKYICFLF